MAAGRQASPDQGAQGDPEGIGGAGQGIPPCRGHRRAAQGHGQLHGRPVEPHRRPEQHLPEQVATDLVGAEEQGIGHHRQQGRQ